VATRMAANAEVSFDSGPAEPIMKRSPQPKGFGTNRSEVIDAVPAEFFGAWAGTMEAVWEVVGGWRTSRRES
jgi:hypothetical protein